MRRPLATGLKVVLGLALIAWLVSQVDVEELSALARAGQPVDLVLGMGAFVVALAGFQALRLHVLLRRHTGGLGTSYTLFFIGAFFNNLLPSNVGGDAVRLLYLRNMGAGGVGGPLALLLLHRLSGLGVLLVGAGIYGVLRPARVISAMTGARVTVSPGVALGVLVGAALLAGGALWLLSRRPALWSRVTAQLASAREAVGSLGGGDWGMLLALTVSFHGARLLGFIWVARYLGQAVDPLDLVFVLAVAAVAALLPLSVAGLGVMEGSISYLLVAFGMAPAAAISAALAHRVGLLLMALVGGLVYLGARNELQKAAAARSAEGA